MSKDKLLVSVTTTKRSDWRHQIKEINKFKIETVGVFPTCLGPRQRPEFYKQLEASCIKSIPHVHLRHDFSLREVNYFIRKFQTKVFVFHYNYLHFISAWPKVIKKKIFIEVSYGTDRIADYSKIEKFGGLCIDFAHLADIKNYFPNIRQNFLSNYKRFKIGCNHINGYLKKPAGYQLIRNIHYIYNCGNLDYLKDMPRDWFSDIICLEMENSVTAQLRYKKYLVKLLKNKL